MEESFNDRKTSVSEFNEASFQIQRLHNLWCCCNLYARRGNLEDWKWVLDRVWVELSADTEKDDKWNKELKEINEHIAKNKKDKDSFYIALQEKEIFLRRLQEKVGKGGKKSQVWDEGM